MPTETYLAGIVLVALLAVALGAVGAMAWTRRKAGRAEDPAKPVLEAMARMEAQIREFELQRQHSLGGLEQHLNSLSQETVACRGLCARPTARGRWGELTLRRVAELAGMAAQCDFFEQESADGMRPDMLVKLPGNRILPVDAKAPFSGVPGCGSRAG